LKLKTENVWADTEVSTQRHISSVQFNKRKQNGNRLVMVAFCLFSIVLAASVSVRDGYARNVSGRGHGEHNQVGGNGERVISRARAEIKGDRISGTAELVEVERGTQRLVRVTLRLKGDKSTLTPGLHGIHIHEKGMCESPFTSAGGHFDPGPASNTDPDVNHPFHMGDLPNIRINNDGSGALEATTTRVMLSDGPLSVFDQDGSAIIIHGGQDQLTSGASKSGVSGGQRIACGIIVRQ